jgi:hypothetical protein
VPGQPTGARTFIEDLKSKNPQNVPPQRYSAPHVLKKQNRQLR